MICCLRTRVHKQPIIVRYFESEINSGFITSRPGVCTQYSHYSPAPVLPMTPTFSLGNISKDTFLNTGSISGRYLITTSLNITEPWLGHSGGAIL